MRWILILLLEVGLAGCLPRLDRLALETFNLLRMFDSGRNTVAPDSQQDGVREGMPLFHPGPGEYFLPVSLGLTTTLDHAIIRYTVNGQDPFCGTPSQAPIGFRYENPIAIPQPSLPGLEVRAITCFSLNPSSDSEKFLYSQIAQGVFTVWSGILDPPIASLAPGSFTSPVTLTFQKPASNASVAIHYTVDGSTPTCGSPIYTAALAINHSQTVRAISCMENWAPSHAVGGFYEITGTVATPGFSQESGLHNNDISLTLTEGTSGATIRYALTVGSDPVLTNCSGGNLYTGAIPITRNDTRVIAIGCKAGWLDSPVSSIRVYNLQVATPILATPGGVYQSDISISGTSSTVSATVHYNTTGLATCADPSIPVSLLANQGIEVPTTLHAIGCKADYLPSNPVTANYTMTGTLPTPQFSIAGGALAGPETLILSPGTGAPPSGVFHLFTTNGTDPVCPSTGTVYSGGISILASQTVKARSCKATPLWNPSPIRAEVYTITGQVAAPTFSASPGLVGGLYSNAQTVTIDTSTSGATIRYTVGDGTQADPTCATGTLGTSFSVENNTNNVIKAIACHIDYTPSIVSTSPTYQLVVLEPVPSVIAGAYTTAQNIGFTSGTSLATIHYTTNGSDPNCSDPSPPIALPSPTASVLVKAIGCRAGFVNSPVFIGTYEVTGQVAAPTIGSPVGLTNAVSITANPQPPIGSQVVCYRTDGTPQCSDTHLGAPSATGGNCAVGSNVYTTAIPFSSTTTLRAVSCSANWLASNVQEQVVSIPSSVGDVLFTPDPALEANNDYSVTLTATNSTHIYFTVNGTTPSCSGIGTLYSGPILVDKTGIPLQAIGCANGYSPSLVASKSTLLKVGTPTLGNPPAESTLENDYPLNWNFVTTGASHYYRLDGTYPDCSNTGAVGTVALPASLNLPVSGHSSPVHMIRIRGCKSNYVASDGVGFDFTLKVAAPVMKTTEGSIFQSASANLARTDILFSTNTSSGKVCVTFDGTDPDCSAGGACLLGTEYTAGSPYDFSATTEIRARGCRSGYEPSAITNRNFTFDANRLRLFVTNSVVAGNTNLATADAICALDLFRPSPHPIYKALRMGGGRNGTTDWPLLENKTYYRSNAIAIGTSLTGNPGFSFPLSQVVLDTSKMPWTGMNVDGAGVFSESADTCMGWTSNSGVEWGRTGESSASGTFAFDNQNLSCSNSFPLYCVESPPPVGPPKRIFISATKYGGNMGGIAGADNNCQIDAKHPGGGAVFKALVASTTRDRTMDWVLLPSTTYYQLDLVTQFLLTDALARPLEPITSEHVGQPSGSFPLHGGFTADFLQSTGVDHCANYTSSAGGGSSRYHQGQSGSTNMFVDGTSFFTTFFQTCGTISHLICVEQ